jgi:hypothetical protein
VRKEKRLKFSSLIVLAFGVTTLFSTMQISLANVENTISVQDSMKGVNLSANPGGLLLGSLNLRAEIGVSDNIAVGPYVSYRSHSASLLGYGGTASALGIGAAATFSIGHARFTDGWFASPYLGYGHGVAGSSYVGSTMTAGANFGYWWFWNSGFNVGLGLGAEYAHYVGHIDGIGDGSLAGIVPSGMLQVGYAF